MAPSILIDSSNSGLVLNSTRWETQNTTGALGGSALVWSPGSKQSNSSSLSCVFDGVGISVFGMVARNASANYTLDGGKSDISFKQNSSRVSNFWTVGGLEAGEHTFEVAPTSGRFTLDYFVVTPSPETPLAKKDLLYDDADPIVRYGPEGHWTIASPEGVGTWNKTVHQSKQEGDALEFRFIGDRVALYGVRNQRAGKLRAAFSVDSSKPEHVQIYDGSQRRNDTAWDSHVLFFEKELSSGLHRVTVIVEEVTEDQAFFFDYFITRGTEATTLAPYQGPRDRPIPPPTASSYIGIAMAAVIVVGALVAFLWHKYKERQNWGGEKAMMDEDSARRDQRYSRPPSFEPHPHLPVAGPATLPKQNLLAPPQPQQSPPYQYRPGSKAASRRFLMTPNPFNRPKGKRPITGASVSWDDWVNDKTAKKPEDKSQL